MDTAPDNEAPRHRAARRTIVKASYDECWRTVEQHASARMPARSSTRSTMTISSRATEPSASRSWRTCLTSTLSSRRSAAAACSPASACAVNALRPTRVFTRRSPQPRRRWPHRCAPAAPAASRRGRPSFVDGAGGRSVLPTMWPLLSALGARIAGGVAGRRGAGDAGRRRPRPRDRRRRGGVRRRGGAVAGVRARGHQKIVAVVSGGNIDLARFADGCARTPMRIHFPEAGLW